MDIIIISEGQFTKKNPVELDFKFITVISAILNSFEAPRRENAGFKFPI